MMCHCIPQLTKNLEESQGKIFGKKAGREKKERRKKKEKKEKGEQGRGRI
jgi:hypothetical protein